MATQKEIDLDNLIKHIEKYRHKAVVLREIHSKLAQNCRNKDILFTLLTVVFVSLTAFLGFSGADTLREVIGFFSSDQNTLNSNTSLLDNEKVFSFVFNLFVFIVFLGSLFNLIYRWKENHTLHFQGVVKLAHFINWLDTTSVIAKKYDPQIVKDISFKYEAIIDVLPPNDDCDYIEAKRSLIKKSVYKVESPLLFLKCLRCLSFKLFSPNFLSSPNFDRPIKGELFFKDLIASSELIIPLLKSIRNTDGRLWLGGGIVRNYVWDKLTGRITPIGDIDVVYFDNENMSDEGDKKLENRLIEKSEVGLKWSVKNQARMYKDKHEGEVTDLCSAIYNWPETATAIIIRLDENENLRIIAPHGLDDLFSLVVQPTPFHKNHPASYKRRLIEKRWVENWPELNVKVLD